MVENCWEYKGLFIWKIEGKYQTEGDGKRFNTLAEAKKHIRLISNK